MSPIVKTMLRYTSVSIRMLGISAGLLLIQNNPEAVQGIALVRDHAWIFLACLALNVFYVFRDLSGPEPNDKGV